MKHEGDGVVSCDWCVRNDPQSFGKGTGRLRNQRTSGDNTN